VIVIVYKKCPKCGKKYGEYEQCECMIQAKKDSYKRYKDRRMMDKEEKKRQAFYCSKDWLKVRDAVISDCFGMDIVMFYQGLIESGYTCHHIIPLEDDFNSLLDINNIIYMTEQTHQLTHVEYNKGERQKKVMQKLLFGLLDKFNKEFKVKLGDRNE